MSFRRALRIDFVRKLGRDVAKLRRGIDIGGRSWPGMSLRAQGGSLGAAGFAPLAAVERPLLQGSPDSADRDSWQFLDSVAWEGLSAQTWSSRVDLSSGGSHKVSSEGATDLPFQAFSAGPSICLFRDWPEQEVIFPLPLPD